MSAENFHTIKKISSSIIYEPPLEFQDNYPNSVSTTKYPPNFTSTTNTISTPSTVIRTTHIQSYASRLTQNIIRKAINTFHSLATKEVYYCEKHAAAKLKKQKQQMQQAQKSRENIIMDSDYLKSKTFTGYSIYGSDSFLNNYHKPSYLTNGKSSNSNINIVDSDEDDIYDEPNAEYDVIYKDNKDTILCTKRIVRSLEKKKVDARSQIYCNTDELFYEKCHKNSSKFVHSTAINNHNNNNVSTNNRNSNDTNISVNNVNKFQSNSFQKKFDKFLRSKFHNTNITPTTTTSSIFYSFCHHTGAAQICNSSSHPNSKSSLNSRLSSSHNSLTVPTNKADDSIFITQAMSHDQLGHSIEISDFYNVPLDSDIYTLPIDVIHTSNVRRRGDDADVDDDDIPHHMQHYRATQRAMSDNNLLSGSGSKCHKFHRSKNKRSKRKKRSEAGNEGSNLSRKLSNTSSSVVTSHSFTVNHESGRKVSGDRLKSKVLLQSSNSGSNNNNSNSNYSNNESGSKLRKNSDGIKIIKGDNSSSNVISNNNNTSNSGSKYGSAATATKKSQFSISLNLKQKFCSIFRFKKSHQTSPSRNVNLTHTQDEEKKVNLSTRALPPLPEKGDILYFFSHQN